MRQESAASMRAKAREHLDIYWELLGKAIKQEEKEFETLGYKLDYESGEYTVHYGGEFMGHYKTRDIMVHCIKENEKQMGRPL